MRALWSNSDCRLLDLGERVLQVELCSPDMVLTSLTLDGLQAALDELQDERWSGLVVSSAGPHFGLGASLPTLWENFEKGQWDLLEARGKRFQSIHLALAQHPKPVVAAVRGYALGGGCELALHCHSVLAQPDARLGLVESRAGILPAAGGSKEMAMRAGSARQLCQALICLARGQLASDAEEAFELGYLRPEWDRVGTLDDAARRVHELGQLTRPPVASGFRLVCGYPELLEFLEQEAQGWSRFDRCLGESAARLLTGGKSRGEWVEVQELLDLERALLRELGSSGRSRARMRYLLQAGLIQQLQNP